MRLIENTYKRKDGFEIQIYNTMSTYQLLNEHRKTVQKIKQNEWKKQGTTTSPSSRPWTTPRSSLLNNPQLNSSKKADMQFFGPKDYVPKAPHNLPLRPMRLKYSSTKEFPTRTYGRLVPMPR